MSDFRDSCAVPLALDRELIGIVCCLIDHLGCGDPYGSH